KCGGYGAIETTGSSGGPVTMTGWAAAKLGKPMRGCNLGRPAPAPCPAPPAAGARGGGAVANTPAVTSRPTSAAPETSSRPVLPAPANQSSTLAATAPTTGAGSPRRVSRTIPASIFNEVTPALVRLAEPT